MLKLQFTLLFVTIFISMGQELVAQVKYEREKRISATEVPLQAKHFLDSIELPHSVRWYQEETIDSIHYEAKTKYLGEKYSIEFNAQGKLQDVEKLIRWEDIPKEAKTNIQNCFDQDFKKWKLDRVQIQYSGNSKAIARLINEKQLNTQEISIFYELEVIDKKNHVLYEYLFDAYGSLKQKLLIVLSNDANLVY